MHLADAFIQSNLQTNSGYTFFLSVFLSVLLITFYWLPDYI